MRFPELDGNPGTLEAEKILPSDHTYHYTYKVCVTGGA